MLTLKVPKQNFWNSEKKKKKQKIKNTIQAIMRTKANRNLLFFTFKTLGLNADVFWSR